MLLANRHCRHFQRKPSCLPNATFYFFCTLSHVAVTRIGVGPGIHDSNNRFSHKIFATKAHFHGAASMAKRTHIIDTKPALAAQFFECFPAHCFLLRHRRMMKYQLMLLIT